MNQSILTSIKKLLGIAENYTDFDQDVIIHINTVFSILNQLGVGPAEGFSIKDASTKWEDYIESELKLEDVQSLINAGKLEGTRIFLEIELNNGVSFRQLYWVDSNTFHIGAIGTNEIKEVINYEVSKLKK